MKNIVSKITTILSVILIAISICGISSIDCLKGFFPLQRALINSEDILYGLEHGDINFLPMGLVQLFYTGNAFILLSGIIRFSKTNKIKGVIITILSFIPTMFVLITHNYIWFLVLTNLYLFINLLVDFALKDKINILSNILAFVITTTSIIQLIKHLQLTFNSSDISTFQVNLIKTSTITLNVIWLWLIPYIILLIKDIIITCKSYRTAN